MSTPLPHDLNVEKEVLGCMLMQPDRTVSVVLSAANENIMYIDRHKEIFLALASLYEKNEPIDLVIAGDELRRRGSLDKVGGMHYLSECTSLVVSSANIERHVRILAELAMRRATVQHSGDFIAAANDRTKDIFATVDEMAQLAYKLFANLVKRSHRSIGSVLKPLVDKISNRRNDPKQTLAGITTGFARLDELLIGFVPANLVIIAARPSIGKTALGICMARRQAETGIPVGICSLEMSEEELALRMVSMEAKVDMGSIRRSKLRDEQYRQILTAHDRLAELPIYIYDEPGVSPLQLRAVARRMIEEHDIQILYVDYLQLMTDPQSGRESREREVASISRKLKELAKDLRIPVVAIAQLNRSVEARQGGKPILSDLRESGAIEQDADVVMFVHRNRDIDCPPEDQGRAEIIVAKQRNGETGMAPLAWIGEYAKFADLEVMIPDPPQGMFPDEEKKPF